MDLLYAITLIIAIAAGVLAFSVSVLALFRKGAPMAPAVPIWRVRLLHHVTAGALALGTFSLMISVAVHSRWGHGPATVAPMGFERLTSEHEAFPTVAAILFLGFALTAYGQWRKRRCARIAADRR